MSTSTRSRGTCDEDRGDRRRVRDRRPRRETPARKSGGTEDCVPGHRRGRTIRLLLPRGGRRKRGERYRGPTRGFDDRGRDRAAAGDARRLWRPDLLQQGETPNDPAGGPGDEEAQRAADDPAVLLRVPTCDPGRRGTHIRSDGHVRDVGHHHWRGTVPRAARHEETGREAVRDLRADRDGQVNPEQARLRGDPLEGRRIRPHLRHAQRVRGFHRDGKSVVLDFGDYGTDQMVYLFVANILSRRLFELYTERNEEYPRLVLFLEEAHKFLSPEIAPYAHTFSRLARETRKFNLILALVDQRPSRISDEVRSQLANRLVMSLKEPSDVEAALAGVPDKKMWENIIAKLPLRTVAVIGDAIRIPTVIDVLDYDNENVREHVIGSRSVDEGRLQEIAKRADDVFGRG